MLLGLISNLTLIVGAGIEMQLPTYSFFGHGYGVLSVVMAIAAWHIGHPFALRASVRKFQNAASHSITHCTHCDYSLQGLPTPICPECGTDCS